METDESIVRTIMRTMSRREALGAMGAASAALALGCSGESVASPTTSTGTTATTTGSNATCAVTPTETVGPYPSLVDLIRSDVREDRTGTLLTLTIKVVNANSSCAPVANADVEIWHCDVAGSYSQYGASTGRTFLRGIQRSDANGDVTFTTIYPGWYQGRATHIHLEVSINGVSRKVTQIAFPEGVNNAVHAAGVYASRGTNPMTNAADGIFADSLSAELVTPTGSVASGYAATFQVGVAL